jgi:hypothetical protein
MVRAEVLVKVAGRTAASSVRAGNKVLFVPFRVEDQFVGGVGVGLCKIVQSPAAVAFHV